MALALLGLAGLFTKDEDEGFSWWHPSTWFLAPDIESGVFFGVCLMIFLYALYEPAKKVAVGVGNVAVGAGRAAAEALPLMLI
jgi:hypothetical protein